MQIKQLRYMLETPKAAPLVPTENEADVTVDNKQATPKKLHTSLD